MKKLVLILGFSALACSSAYARQDCSQYETQSQLTDCAVNNMNDADNKLQRVYDSYKKKLSPKEKANLIASERAWVKQKEHYCRTNTESSPDGSMYGMEVAMCLEKKADARVVELNKMMRK